MQAQAEDDDLEARLNALMDGPPSYSIEKEKSMKQNDATAQKLMGDMFKAPKQIEEKQVDMQQQVTTISTAQNISVHVTPENYNSLLKKCTTDGFWPKEATTILMLFLAQEEQKTFNNLLQNGHNDATATAEF